jgi:hypothetical protein
VLSVTVFPGLATETFVRSTGVESSSGRICSETAA